MLKNIFRKQNYHLVRELVRTDFKLRYQGSVLGYLWSLLRPLALFTILYLVFAKVFKLGGSIPHYPAYLLLGIVLWTYFLEATSIGLRSIVDKGDMIRKVKVPNYVIVLATSFSAFVNLLLNLIVVSIFLVVSGAQVSSLAVLFPLLLVELLIFSGAVSFILAALYVKFRDITHIWELLLQLMFYATPIIYPLSLVPRRFAKIVMLNPLAQIIQDSRFILVTPKTQTGWSVLGFPLALMPLVIIVATVMLATSYFKRESKTFAENV